ncbi:MAG: patatin-like phospholipase family protein, partial [Chloroflexota bacterium]
MSSIRNKPKVGVIIGSGSVKSTAAIGLFQVLAREGIDVDMIVGTSGGAVVGASIALGPSLKDASHRIHNNWTKEVMTEFDYRAILQITMSRIFEFTSDFSIFGDTRIMENLRSHFGDLTFADLSLPLYMVATDATSGKPV